MESSSSIVTSSSVMPGRSARRTKWSSDSSRSIAGIQRRMTPLPAPPARRVEDGVEEPVHLRLQRAQLAQRLPADDGHGETSGQEGLITTASQYEISVRCCQVSQSLRLRSDTSAAPGIARFHHAAICSCSAGSKWRRKRSRTPSRCVAPRLGEDLLAALGQDGEAAAAVGVAGVAHEQPVALQAVDEAGHARAAQQHAVGQLGHPAAPARGGLQVDQHLVGGQRQPVRRRPAPRRAPSRAALWTRRRPRQAPSSAGASSRSGTSADGARRVPGVVVPVLIARKPSRAAILVARAHRRRGPWVGPVRSASGQQGAAGHLLGRLDPEQRERGRRDVGEDALAGERVGAGGDDERHRVERVRGVRRAVRPRASRPRCRGRR